MEKKGTNVKGQGPGALKQREPYCGLLGQESFVLSLPFPVSLLNVYH